MLKTRMKKRWLKKDEKGIVGIGTLIVFIAMVLVAAIAAAVIINTASRLQQNAEKTTADTVHDLGIGLMVVNVVAHIDQSQQMVDNLFIYFELNPGAESMNLKTVTIMILTENTGNDTVANLVFRDAYYVGGAVDTTRDGKHYYIYDNSTLEPNTQVQIGGLDPNNGYDAGATPARYYVDQDSLLVAQICLGNKSMPALGSPMPPGSFATIKFIPSGGGSIGLREFRIPGSLDMKEWIDLY